MKILYQRQGYMRLKLLIASILMITSSGFAQVATCNQSSIISNFGIDANVNANTTSINSDDWFQNNLFPGNGIGVIGTGASTATPSMSASTFGSLIQGAANVVGRNRTYLQRMGVPFLTTQNNMLLLDAFAARDNISSGSALDSSVFSSGGDKNGDNPNTWALGVGGIQQKNDLVDVGGHLRRDLSTNELWGFAFMTILSPGGDGYADVEIFRTTPTYTNGSFTNTGSQTSGGHTPFKFNSTGAIQEPGDVLVSINYGSSAGTASVRVWINPNNVDGAGHDTAWLNQQSGRPFAFTGDYITGLNSGSFGYAEIKEKSAATCIVYTNLNTANTQSGAWGSLAGSGAGYTSTLGPSQFVEMAINFTEFGLDLRTVSGDCFNIFGSVLYKTRSSSSWSSELKDFAGPFTFGNFTEVQANGGSDKTITCQATQVTLDGTSATPGASFQWTTLNGTIISGANTSTPTVSQAGTYFLAVVSPTLATCIARDTVIVTANNTVPTANAGTDNVVNCTTGNSITLSGSSSATSATYQWTAINGGNIFSGATTLNPTVNAAGTYILSVTTGSNGCSASDTVVVTNQTAVPVISNVVSTNPTCFNSCNGSIVVTATSAFTPLTYSWSNSSTSSTISSLCTGTYTIIVTGANGCTTTANYNLIEPAELTNNFSLNEVLCFGNTTGSINNIVIGGTTPYTYAWSNGATTQSLSNIEAGTYTVIITDAQNCVISSTSTVNQPTNALTVNTSKTDILCSNDLSGAVNSLVSGGTMPYTYTWSNGATTNDITNVGAGTYVLTVMDANGCSATSSQTLTQPAAALSGSLISTAVLCHAGNTGAVESSIAGGTTPYSFNWSNGGNTDNINAITAGTYTLSVTDANGCTITLNTTVTEPAAALSVTGYGTNILCYGNSTGAVNVTVIGGTFPYNYYWSNNATSQDLSNLAAGSYAVTVTDKNNCSTSFSTTLAQPSGPLNIQLNETNILCRNDATGSLISTTNGGTTPYQYQWSNGSTTPDITNQFAGSYTLTVTDAHGCSAMAIETLTQPAAILYGSLTPTAVLCHGGNTGSITSTIAGGTAPYTYDWSNGYATANLINLNSSPYSVTVTDANGCTINLNTTIAEPSAALTINASPTTILCYGNNTAAIDITVTGGTTPYNYNWSNNATTEDINNLIAGAYQITVTDKNGCTENYSTIITQPTTELDGKMSCSEVKCFQGSDGIVSIVINGGTAPYTYLWNNGATTAINNNLSEGTYTVTVTDANGCTFVESRTVNQPSAPLALSETHTDLSCFSQPQGSIDLTVSGGTSPYTYSWSNGFTSQDISNIAAGTYTITVIDQNNCTAILSATLSQPAGELNVSSIVDHVNCHEGTDGSIELSLSMGTPPYSIQWSTGASSNIISNLTAGVYTATVSDANGCNLILSNNIQEPGAALSVSDSTHPVYCFGQSTGAVLTTVTGGTQPYTYNWSNGATSADITNVSSGAYTLTVTDALGCILNNTSIISQPTVPLSVTETITQPHCVDINDGQIQITVKGGTAPYTVLWSSGDSTNIVSNLAPGNYTVLITDAVNCTISANYTISYTAPQLTVSGQSTSVLCQGNSTGDIITNTSGGTAPYTFNWSNGSTTASISNIAAGTYTVTVTDINGCITDYSNIVSEPSASLIANEQHTAVNCFGDATGSINVTVSGGIPAYSYQWNDGYTSEDRTNIGSGSYSVIITDANGCTTAVSATIHQPAASLNGSGTVTNVLCNSNATGDIVFATSGGTNPYFYNWSNGATTSSIQNLTAGTYTVNVVDANNCMYQDVFTITQPAAGLTISSSTQAVSCMGISNGAISLIVSGGAGNYNYLWSNGATTQNLNGLVSGNYTITITDNNNCSSSSIITVSQPPQSLSVTGTITDANCIYGQLGNIVITPTGGTQPYTFSWSNGNSNQNLNNVLPGTYYITATDSKGCTAGNEFLIKDNSSVTIQAMGNTTICVGNQVMISAQFAQPIASTLQWHYNGNPLTGATTPSFSTPVAGTYTLVATTGCGSYTSNPIEVAVRSLNSITITNDLIVCPGESVQLTASGGIEYLWSPSQGLSDSTSATPMANPMKSTQYKVTVKDDFGCTATASVMINVMCDTLDIPNGFSPNEDGTNDTFVIDGLSKYPVNVLWIYNRWGNLVYKKNNYDNTWDGRSNVNGIALGQDLPNGTYYFVLDLKLEQPFKGFVVIRR